MKDFKDSMSKRTDSELLEITTILRDDYQPEALVAAETELKSRNLTDEQLTDAQQLLDNKKREQEKKDEKQKLLQNKAASIADTLNPLTKKSTDKTIRIVTIGLAICFLAYFVTNWGLIVVMLQDIANSDISSLEFFAPFILFPIGLYGFWTTKKYGWIILTIVLTYSAVTTLFAMGLEIKWAMQSPIHFVDDSGFVQIEVVENNVMDVLFAKKGIAFYIGKLILLAGLLVFLNKKTITEKYMISKRTQSLVVGLTAIPCLLFGLVIFM